MFDIVVLIDDACPNGSGNTIEALRLTNLHVLYNKTNRGVGFSTKRGFNLLLELGCCTIVKVDADGQIKPKLALQAAHDISCGVSEVVKGNRFSSRADIRSMPIIRLMGNLILSFANKLSSGYWELFDPTNGLIAVSSSVWTDLRTLRIDDRYFFETDFLFQCALEGVVIDQLPMIAVYADEVTSLKPFREIGRFFYGHLRNLLTRIVYHYFIRDVNVGSLDLLLGLMLGFCSALISIKVILRGLLGGGMASPGEASLTTLLAVTSFQAILAFLYFDATYQPQHRRWKREAYRHRSNVLSDT